MTSIEDLRALYDYIYWANGRLLRTVEDLTSEEFTRTVAGSYGAVRDTMVHMLKRRMGVAGSLPRSKARSSLESFGLSRAEGPHRALAGSGVGYARVLGHSSKRRYVMQRRVFNRQWSNTFCDAGRAHAPCRAGTPSRAGSAFTADVGPCTRQFRSALLLLGGALRFRPGGLCQLCKEKS